MWLTETEMDSDKENRDYRRRIGRVVPTHPFQARPLLTLSNNSTPMPSPSKAFAAIPKDKPIPEADLKQDHFDKA
jgi:hypothetical protein